MLVGHQVLRAAGRRPSLTIPYAERRPVLYEKVLKFVKSEKGKQCLVQRLNRVIVENWLKGDSVNLVPIDILVENDCLKVWKNVNSRFSSECT